MGTCPAFLFWEIFFSCVTKGQRELAAVVTDADLLGEECCCGGRPSGNLQVKFAAKKRQKSFSLTIYLRRG